MRKVTSAQQTHGLSPEIGTPAPTGASTTGLRPAGLGGEWCRRTSKTEFRPVVNVSPASTAVVFRTQRCSEAGYSRVQVAIYFAYFALLAAVLATMIGLDLGKRVDKVDLTIEFNVGEIIGALLGGGGIAAAGGAYAAKTLSQREP